MFIGEVFSLFIIVIAAIETAIGLCLILSFYKITNKNISPNLNIETFLSVVITIGNSGPLNITAHGIKMFLIYAVVIFLTLHPMKAFYHARSQVVRVLHGVKHDDEFYKLEALIAWARPNQSCSKMNYRINYMVYIVGQNLTHYRNISIGLIFL
jgi:hypothetical protein